MMQTCCNVKVESVSFRGADFYFRVFILYHYFCDVFYKEAVGKTYLLHLPFVYRVKCLGEFEE